MAPLLEDPRFRQTWNQISHNAESATETAAANIWTFQHEYVSPCFTSITTSCEQCAAHCIPDRDDRARRLRERGRITGRAELSFDFYDDWDEDDRSSGKGLLGGWGNDELDRLLAGTGSQGGGNGVIDQAPRKKRGMSYGTRGRRKSLDVDPTIIPSTSALGFLGRLPFKLGGALRYKPSAADLQDHPAAMRTEFMEEGEPLLSEMPSEDDGHNRAKGHSRNRSSTVSSGETSDSFRSRGDLFPSDGEDDAVPLSDEFAMVLERRMTGSGMDDRSSGKTRSSKGKRPAGSRTLSRNLSGTQQTASQIRLSSQGRRPSSSASPTNTTDMVSPDIQHTPSLADLRREEEFVEQEEELEAENKRQAAAHRARERGLRIDPPSREFKVGPSSENIPPLELSHLRETEDQSKFHPLTNKEDPSADDVSLSRSLEARILQESIQPEFIPARLPHFS